MRVEIFGCPFPLLKGIWTAGAGWGLVDGSAGWDQGPGRLMIQENKNLGSIVWGGQSYTG